MGKSKRRFNQKSREQVETIVDNSETVNVSDKCIIAYRIKKLNVNYFSNENKPSFYR